MKILIKSAMALCLVLFTLTLASAQVVKSGNLKGDKVDWTTGSVEVVKSGSGHKIKLGSNFKTKQGPALYVYLGNGKPEKRIAKLKSISGAQSYSVPGSVDIGKYSKVYIYCVPFKVSFGSGRLK